MAAIWTPLESNPEVMTKYIHKLGVSNKWSLTDVYGLDPEALAMVEQPVKAVIFLFPCSKTYEQYRAKDGENLPSDPSKLPEDLFFMKQVIHNACGTIALVHGIANSPDIEIADGSILKKYLDATKSLSPEERGKILEADAAFANSHQESAREGQTASNPEEEVNYHFVTLIHKNGKLYEMDGRKNSAIEHAETTDNTLLQDSAKVIQKFISLDKDNVNFTVIALTAAEN